MDDYINVYEAAQMLGRHVNTIRNYIRAGKGGKLPNTFKRGNIVLVHVDDVEALLGGRDEELETSEVQRDPSECTSGLSASTDGATSELES